MNKKTRAILSGIGAALISGTVNVGPETATKMVYDAIFSKRIVSYQPLAYELSDFPGLRRSKHQFMSNDGQFLTGYMYYHNNITPKAVLILSHGFGGGGQRTYMDCTNYFVQNGFYVFAYDATANDESEGDGIEGFPQGTIDLSCAIDYVKSLNKYKSFPMVLFGHSWGGYNVCNVLNYHPSIKAVCAISGFNKSSGVVEANAHKYAGGSENLVLPYIEEYEEDKFGTFATSTSISGFKNSSAGVYIVHSGDDDVVPYTAGYKLYWNEFKNNPRFQFELYEDRGHGTCYYSPNAVAYTKNFQKGWKEFQLTNPTEKEKLAYINKHLDRSIWINRIDKQLFKNIVEFYNRYI